MSFTTTEVYDIAPGARGDAIELSLRRLPSPFTKDYDTIAGEGPAQWARQFNLANWAFFCAFMHGRPIGGAAVARDTPGLDLLEGRRDLAVLWDIRVDPTQRGHGAGTALFEAAASWAHAQGCRQLKVETQNINVPACRFYARQGCELDAAHRGAYPQFPDEIQLLWHKNLGASNVDEKPGLDALGL